ncbi:restriction endonuclease [Prevotella veroralis]|nr:restriction endonuclease [Prevotella veroralis]
MTIKNITPEEYEKYVASLYQAGEYKTIVTPLAGDWGIDIIATKGFEEIAIQARMYGHTSRKVNRSNIMEFYSAMTYQDRTKAALATDGELLDDAVFNNLSSLHSSIKYTLCVPDNIYFRAPRNVLLCLTIYTFVKAY